MRAVSSAAPPTPPSAPPNPGVAALALVDLLDAALPQTQCTRCGYPDCRAYAQALADGDAEADQCPPGGADGARRLARLLGRAPLPLNPANGVEGPRQRVFIDERTCIGCTLCIQACPVDAIIGAPKRMHAVIEADCTGCELCLPVCPVDCLVLEDASAGATGWAAWSPAQADEARARYGARTARLARDEREQARHLSAVPVREAPSAAAPVDPKRAAIEAALARARLRAQMRPS